MQRFLLKDQNHYLLRLIHGQTTSTTIHINFWLKLHPLGQFRSSLLVMGVSDRCITKDGGFYHLLERNDELIADRGFQIQEDFHLHFCRLVAPPGARAKSQMKKFQVRKTKKVANLRIHVKRAIN